MARWYTFPSRYLNLFIFDVVFSLSIYTLSSVKLLTNILPVLQRGTWPTEKLQTTRWLAEKMSVGRLFAYVYDHGEKKCRKKKREKVCLKEMWITVTCWSRVYYSFFSFFFWFPYIFTPRGRYVNWLAIWVCELYFANSSAKSLK